MAGLGTVQQDNATYLSLAGGYIWDRKADESNPNFATQDITQVEFKTHDKYGESINASFDAGGENYIISISTNNRYSQDMMKALLKIDLQKEVYLKPYDFVDNDGRRARGIVFRQDGEKVDLRNNEAPSQESAWFKTSSKKQIKRFFEDLTDWYIAEVEENVIPKLGTASTASKSGLGGVQESTTPTATVEEAEGAPQPETPKVSPLKMKKALKEYIAENYEGETLPKLSKEDLEKWYNLSLEEEELPFENIDSGEVSNDDLDSQLDALLG